MSYTTVRQPARLLAILALFSLLTWHMPASEARLFWNFSSHKTQTATPRQTQSVSTAVLQEVNRFRLQHQLPPVRLDPKAPMQEPTPSETQSIGRPRPLA